jgi:hypothetical protein
MESAKRASVVIIVWHLNFSFFFEKRGSKGKEVKKQSKKALEENAPTNKKCNSELVLQLNYNSPS